MTLSICSHDLAIKQLLDVFYCLLGNSKPLENS